MRDTDQLTPARLDRITRRAIMGDHENVPLPLDDLADWRDEIEAAAYLGVAKAWAQNWRSDVALTKAARREAIREAMSEHRRRGASFDRAGKLERIAKQVNADAFSLADEAVANDEPNPPAGIEIDEQAAIARELLATLPPDERRAIELTTMGGATLREAAQVMGIAFQRVHELRNAGLRTLREVMQ